MPKKIPDKILSKTIVKRPNPNFWAMFKKFFILNAFLKIYYIYIYNEFVLCLKRGGDDDSCKPARQLAHSICPDINIEEWDEQRANGNFLGVQVKKD